MKTFATFLFFVTVSAVLASGVSAKPNPEVLSIDNDDPKSGAVPSLLNDNNDLVKERRSMFDKQYFIGLIENWLGGSSKSKRPKEEITVNQSPSEMEETADTSSQSSGKDDEVFNNEVEEEKLKKTENEIKSQKLETFQLIKSVRERFIKEALDFIIRGVAEIMSYF